MIRTSAILTLACLAGLAASANAAVVLVDTGFAFSSATNTTTPSLSKITGTGSPTAGSIYTHAYGAGASFSTLVVTVSREGRTFSSVKYAGVDMNLATGNSNVSIFYLNTTATSGNLVVDFSGSNTNGVGIGIAAIKSDNGDPIGLYDANSGTGTTININTADASFTMWAVDTNLNPSTALPAVRII